MRPKLLTRNQKTPPAARSGKERCICSETSYRRLLGGGLLLPVLLLEGFLLLNEIPEHRSAFQLGTAGTVHAIPLTQLCSCLSDQHSASSSVTWGTDQHGSMTQPPGSFGTAQPMDEASRSLPTTRRPSPYRQKAASGLP